MLKEGDRITVRSSSKLTRRGLGFLANRSGIVTKVSSNGTHLSGVFADISIGSRTRNYFIPMESIEGPEDINRMRVMSLLKSTIL